MRKFSLAFVLIFLLPLSPVVADDIESRTQEYFGVGNYPGPMCSDCRDPYEYPMDFVAFAYNEYFGDSPSLFGSGIGWPFRVYNPDGNSVLIWFEGILFDMPSLLPDLMDVMLRFENGQVRVFAVIQGGPDIPIGDPEIGPPSGSSACTCSGNGGGDDGEDYEEPDEYELDFEEREPIGIVEIEDPDEDGEFPDWMEEL